MTKAEPPIHASFSRSRLHIAAMITRFTLAAALTVFLLGGAEAHGFGPGRSASAPTSETQSFRLVQSNCASAAARAAAQTGGQVIGAPRAVTQNGQTICVIQLLVPDPNGRQPPTRQTVRVPAN